MLSGFLQKDSLMLGQVHTAVGFIRRCVHMVSAMRKVAFNSRCGNVLGRLLALYIMFHDCHVKYSYNKNAQKEYHVCNHYRRFGLMCVADC